MSTWILILLCLAVAGRELYLAFDRRLPQAQEEIRRLRARVDELERRPDTATVPEEEPEDEPEPQAGPLTRGTPPRPARARATAAAAVSAALTRRLERELAETTARLAALEHQVRAAREAEAARAAALDGVEQTVGALHREMIERLERADDTARGLLYAEEAATEPLLTDAYEHCVAKAGLRVRAKEPVPGAPWWTGYLLSGADPEEVAPRLVAQARFLPDPAGASPLSALLTELAALDGTGLARIGAFAAVRTRDALLCGILTDAPDTTDPVELAAHLEGHATTLRWDPARFAAAVR
ncbi:hypothetical protein [Thermomonospora cellulosilytica]|uniref:Cell division septum initiation protein DivIVA n=1 Tax=Thermomonospora cellulosilytica TaxID=1411118 RepID=A0A7W3MX38_9ACTN|nr:hypothetical protein [Thermomonospora cellulosilytica]MBA9003427.1 cell division septum initiation protein DivIVA [Thermomonospora cellulosilytica]